MPKKQNNPTPSQVNEFESRLQSSLKPIKPDYAFVSRLRYRLENPPEMELEAPSPVARAASKVLLAVTIISVALVTGLWLLNLLSPNKDRAGAVAGEI